MKYSAATNSVLVIQQSLSSCQNSKGVYRPQIDFAMSGENLSANTSIQIQMYSGTL